MSRLTLLPSPSFPVGVRGALPDEDGVEEELDEVEAGGAHVHPSPEGGPLVDQRHPDRLRGEDPSVLRADQLLEEAFFPLEPRHSPPPKFAIALGKPDVKLAPLKVISLAY